jgi:hypothetical protein
LYSPKSDVRTFGCPFLADKQTKTPLLTFLDTIAMRIEAMLSRDFRVSYHS